MKLRDWIRIWIQDQFSTFTGLSDTAVLDINSETCG